MGMPIIESSNVERSQAITDLIVSVALEQAALSHILNAEGEKLQAVIGLATGASPTVTPEMLLEANDSVNEMVSSISTLESHLQAKLAIFADAIQTNFYFMKRDNSNTPLEGAMFELLQGTTQIATASSDLNGVVIFQDIPPGNYTLREISAPSGFDPDTADYAVAVTDNFNATINGIAAAEFSILNTAIPN